MNIGKVSESVLKRSVLKFIKGKRNEVLHGAGVGADCAVFACQEGFLAQAVQSFVLQEASEIVYPVCRAANSVAAGGAEPFSAALSVLLPEETEEVFLQKLMQNAEKAAAALSMQISGGHTEVTAAVSKPCVTVTAAGKLSESGSCRKKASPGQSLVVSKWIGLEGTALLASRCRESLSARYPLHMLDEAAAFSQLLSVLPEAATAAKSNVGAMHDLSGGGIFAALWELAENAGVGLTVDLKKIPIRQETVEVCEFFAISPYELLSGGSLLMSADNGELLVHTLEAAGIPAAVIGTVTDGNDRIVINEDETRFLERPKRDEINKI